MSVKDTMRKLSFLSSPTDRPTELTGGSPVSRITTREISQNHCFASPLRSQFCAGMRRSRDISTRPDISAIAKPIIGVDLWQKWSGITQSNVAQTFSLKSTLLICETCTCSSYCDLPQPNQHSVWEDTFERKRQNGIDLNKHKWSSAVRREGRSEVETPGYQTGSCRVVTSGNPKTMTIALTIKTRKRRRKSALKNVTRGCE